MYDHTIPASAAARLAQIADHCELGTAEAIIPGYEGRSHVGIYADCVVKVFLYKPEVKRPREARALRLLAGTDITPKVLAEADDWIQMTRIPGRQLSELAMRARNPALASQIGRHLRSIHRRGRFPAGDFDVDVCRKVLCHGDFSGRNIMVEASTAEAGQRVTGVIDFEKSEPACFATDLVRYRLSTLMESDTGWPEFVAGYISTGQVDVSHAHLVYHLRDYMTWAAGWAPEIDPPFAQQVRRAASLLISSG